MYNCGDSCTGECMKETKTTRTMNKEFVPYEQALALKEFGFDEPCFGYYGVENEFVLDSMKNTSPNYSRRGFTSAPTYSQSFRWFREKYDKYGVVNIDLSNNLKDKTFVYMVEDKLGYIIDRSEEYKTYEEAELECLIKLISLIKKQII